MDICWPASPKIPFPSNFIYSILGRDDYFLFGLVFIKKTTRLNIFFKKTKTGSNRPVSIQFFITKTGSKPIWLGFSSLARFWHGLARFFLFQA
jgi:hypothetical protein